MASRCIRLAVRDPEDEKRRGRKVIVKREGLKRWKEDEGGREMEMEGRWRGRKMEVDEDEGGRMKCLLRLQD